jgi:hypothetical protein
MKGSFCCFVLVLLLTGCMRYDVTFTNGLKITSVSKPRLNKQTGDYTFVDGSGRKVNVKQGRVLLIQPHQKSNPKSKLKSESFDYYSDFKSSSH